MIEKQTVCLRRLGENRAGEVRLGRWLANEAVNKQEILSEIVKKTGEQVAGRHVLGIQDTTEINYQSHASRVSGLGTVGNGKDAGFFLHPLLVVDAESQSCLGFGAIHTWNRLVGARKDYSRQPIEEKESYRWIQTAQKSKEVLSQADRLTVIADRESDIYEEWVRIPDERTHLLTRACQDRKLKGGTRLFSWVSTLKVQGVYALKVPQRVGKRSAHEAKLQIRFGEVTLLKPARCQDAQAPSEVRLRVVDVKELAETVVGQEEAIHWCLLTTHCVQSKEEALQIVDWYCQRWHIEQLFRTLKKQGLDLESSPIETVEGLLKLSLVALYAALQVMQLTLAREGKDQPISVIFNPTECQLLSSLQPRLEGKTLKQKNPHHPGDLSWAAWTIARLGGWKGYASEAPPAPITILRGLKRFYSLLEGYFLAQELCA